MKSVPTQEFHFVISETLNYKLHVDKVTEVFYKVSLWEPNQSIGKIKVINFTTAEDAYTYGLNEIIRLSSESLHKILHVDNICGCELLKPDVQSHIIAGRGLELAVWVNGVPTAR